MAEKIVMKNGQLQVSDRPIIPLLKGMVLDMISEECPSNLLTKQ